MEAAPTIARNGHVEVILRVDMPATRLYSDLIVCQAKTRQEYLQVGRLSRTRLTIHSALPNPIRSVIKYGNSGTEQVSSPLHCNHFV